MISNTRFRRDNRGLATLDGLRFVLPQVLAQSLPNQSEPLDAPGRDGAAAFDSETPLRAVLLDGTPVAGHRSLNGGVVIEDVHDLVGRSAVTHRRHATSMALLILRGACWLRTGLAISRSIRAKPRFGHTHRAAETTGSCAAPEHAGMVPLLSSRWDGCWRIHNRIGDASRGVSLTTSFIVSSLVSTKAS